MSNDGDIDATSASKNPSSMVAVDWRFQKGFVLLLIGVHFTWEFVETSEKFAA